jgi:signal transduction histidine kinase
MRLAAFAALGVVLTHAAHLVIANRITSRALSREQAALGRNIARQVARQAAEAVLVEDVLALHDLAAGAAQGEGVAYCLIVRDGRALASSFDGPPPEALVSLARAEGGPVVVADGDRRYLDLREPILAGAAGEVRLGLDMGILGATRRELALLLGLLALAVILAGLLAALVVGRGIARPLGELLEAADRFDPARDPRPVVPRGGLEISRLAERFNQMMVRLRGARLEQEQATRRAAATEHMVALGSLVAGVAHEVNNPLAGVKTCLRRLRSERLPPETVDEYLELMEEGVERVEHVMRRLLDFARPQPPRLGPVRLADLARDGAALMEPLLHKRRVALRLEAEGLGDATALADRKEVGQALLNLLLNASYVTPEGGELRLRLRRRPGLLGLAVEDDGPGIPPEVRPRVTDPFFTTKPEGEGTGLGLAVCRAVAESHGGELGFDFPARGTVVTLWLPASRPPAGPGAAG